MKKGIICLLLTASLLCNAGTAQAVETAVTESTVVQQDAGTAAEAEDTETEENAGVAAEPVQTEAETGTEESTETTAGSETTLVESTETVTENAKAEAETETAVESTETAGEDAAADADVKVQAAGAGELEEVQNFQKGANSEETASLITYGQTVYDSITEADNEAGGDYYKFVVPSHGKVTVKIHSELACFQMFARDRGDEWWLKVRQYCNEGLGFIEKEYTYYYNPGTYYMYINGTDGWGSSTGNYTIRLDFTPVSTNETEPNDTFATAQAVGNGSAITGTIDCDNWVDMYKVTLNSAGIVYIDMTSYMDQYDWFLYDASEKKLVGEEEIRLERNAKFGYNKSYMYLEAGTYYIKITDDVHGRYSYPGLYNLKFTCMEGYTSFQGDDENAATANPINLNQTYTGQMSLNETYDTYYFSLSQAGILPLTFKTEPNVSLVIYNADGSVEWEKYPTVYNEDDEKWENGYENTYSIPLAAGTYYFQVKMRSSTGLYEFCFGKRKIESLSLNRSKKTLTTGGTFLLTARMSPITCNVTWSSSNNKVAVVSNGRVTAKNCGTAVITCTATDGSNKKASCTITVVPKKTKLLKTKKLGSNKRKICIKEQKGVTGYEVYTKVKRGAWKHYKTLKSAKKTSFTVKKSFYNSHSFKVRAYKKVGKKKYYGSFSKSL